MTEVRRGAISSDAHRKASNEPAVQGARTTARATDEDRQAAGQSRHPMPRDDSDYVTEWDPRLS
jgi:hypothetical protein